MVYGRRAFERLFVHTGTSFGGWELLFERHAPAREEVAVIAEKNVFSPLRKAWTPPPPPEPEKMPEELIIDLLFTLSILIH